MKKIATILLLLGFSSLSGEIIDKTAGEISLYPLAEKKIKIKVNYNRINDTIDVLNIKEKELGSANVGTIGDASGFDLSLGYGIAHQSALYYNFEYLSVNYGDTKLKNKKHDIFTKINLSHYINNLIYAFSIDLGLTYNSADDLDLRSISLLNSMIQKIRPGTNIEFDGNGITYKDSALYIFDQNGFIVPFIKIANMSDLSFYLRTVGAIEFQNSALHLYAGIKTTSIDSKITLEPSNVDLIASALEEFGDINLKRDEKTIFTGFNYAHSYNDFLFEAGYEYLKIFGRDSKLNEINDNHIFKGAISKQIDDNFRVFIAGKAMLHQFNGVIPYLYNEYTKHKYDKKYGYAKVGFIYTFDTAKSRL